MKIKETTTTKRIELSGELYLDRTTLRTSPCTEATLTYWQGPAGTRILATLTGEVTDPATGEHGQGILHTPASPVLWPAWLRDLAENAAPEGWHHAGLTHAPRRA